MLTPVCIGIGGKIIIIIIIIIIVIIMVYLYCSTNA